MIITFLGFFSLLGVFLLLILVFYFIQFGGNGLSNITTDWGNFGDLLGGTLIPILTIINVLVLYQLTKSAKEIEKQNVFSQIKAINYDNYKTDIEHFIKAWIDLDIKYNHDKSKVIKEFEQLINNLIITTTMFASGNSYIFPELSKNPELKKLISSIKEIPMKEDLDNFLEAKEEFLASIQNNYLK